MIHFNEKVEDFRAAEADMVADRERAHWMR